MKTCQRQVIERLISAQSKRNDMINSETYILPLLRGMAILAQVICSLSDLLLERGWYFTARGQWSSAVYDLGLNKIPDHTIQKTEVVVYVFIPV
jgi:hypothetical protein